MQPSTINLPWLIVKKSTERNGACQSVGRRFRVCRHLGRNVEILLVKEREQFTYVQAMTHFQRKSSFYCLFWSCSLLPATLIPVAAVQQNTQAPIHSIHHNTKLVGPSWNDCGSCQWVYWWVGIWIYLYLHCHFKHPVEKLPSQFASNKLRTLKIARMSAAWQRQSLTIGWNYGKSCKQEVCLQLYKASWRTERNNPGIFRSLVINEAGLIWKKLEENRVHLQLAFATAPLHFDKPYCMPYRLLLTSKRNHPHPQDSPSLDADASFLICDHKTFIETKQPLVLILLESMKFNTAFQGVEVIKGLHDPELWCHIRSSQTGKGYVGNNMKQPCFKETQTMSLVVFTIPHPYTPISKPWCWHLGIVFVLLTSDATCSPTRSPSILSGIRIHVEWQSLVPTAWKAPKVLQSTW